MHVSFFAWLVPSLRAPPGAITPCSECMHAIPLLQQQLGGTAMHFLGIRWCVRVRVWLDRQEQG